MVTFQESLVDNVRQGLCNTLNIAERTAQLGNRFYSTIGLRPLADASGQAAQLWSNAAGVACNRPPQDISGIVGPPFSGGQCEGVLYTVNFLRGRENDPPRPPEDASNCVGPISEGFAVGPSGQPRAFIQTGDGERAGIAGPADRSNDPFLNITSVVRQDGQPDDCGDPPGEGPDYDPADFRVPRTINYDDEGGTPRSVDVDIQFNPVLTDGNDFVVPFEIEFEPGSSLFGDFNLTTGDINIGAGNGDGGGVTDDPVELEDDDEDVPDGLVIVGCRVIVAIDETASRATEIFGNLGTPNLFVPRLGTIRFRYLAPGGGATLGPDISVKQRNELFWSGPVAIGVAKQEDIGSTFTVRLIVVKESAVGLLGGGGST